MYTVKSKTLTITPVNTQNANTDLLLSLPHAPQKSVYACYVTGTGLRCLGRDGTFCGTLRVYSPACVYVFSRGASAALFVFSRGARDGAIDCARDWTLARPRDVVTPHEWTRRAWPDSHNSRPFWRARGTDAPAGAPY